MATKKVTKKKAVIPISGITYVQAKEAIGAGKKATRPLFGEGSFVFHATPFAEMTVEVNGIGQQVNVSAHYNLPYKGGGVLCKATTHILVGWTPSKADLAAKDWIILE